MKKYSSIKGYLERYSLFSLGKLKVRWHKILSSDGTPYFHNHPFSYLSIVCKGSYTEERVIDGKVTETKHGLGSIILRKSKDFHRIKKAKDCRTLFFAIDADHNWDLMIHSSIESDLKVPAEAGVYMRNINKNKVFCKFDKFWYIGSENIETAAQETRLSIYQVEGFEEMHKMPS